MPLNNKKKFKKSKKIIKLLKNVKKKSINTKIYLYFSYIAINTMKQNTNYIVVLRF